MNKKIFRRCRWCQWSSCVASAPRPPSWLNRRHNNFFRRRRRLCRQTIRSWRPRKTIPESSRSILKKLILLLSSSLALSLPLEVKDWRQSRVWISVCSDLGSDPASEDPDQVKTSFIAVAILSRLQRWNFKFAFTLSFRTQKITGFFYFFKCFNNVFAFNACFADLCW